jgi:hypothetical protein
VDDDLIPVDDEWKVSLEVTQPSIFVVLFSFSQTISLLCGQRGGWIVHSGTL